MNLRKYVIFSLVVIVGVVLDQLTKGWVLQNIELYDRQAVFGGFFDLVHYRNTGIAFGLLRNADPSLMIPFFAITGLLALGFLIGYLVTDKTNSLLVPIYLGLIGSGAVGNIIDRVQLGSVVDFILVYYNEHMWPAFNVADASISIGAALLAIDMLLQSKRLKEQEANNQQTTTTPDPDELK